MFGRAGQAGVQVKLKQKFAESTFRCGAIVDILSGGPVRSTWYDIYSAIAAMNNKCVEGGQMGKAVIHAPGGTIGVTLRNPLPLQGPTSLKDGNTTVLQALPMPQNTSDTGVAGY